MHVHDFAKLFYVFLKKTLFVGFKFYVFDFTKFYILF